MGHGKLLAARDIAAPFAAALLAVLWALAEVQTIVTSAPMRAVALICLAMYFVLAFVLARPSLAIASAAALLVALVAAIHWNEVSTLMVGAQTAVVFIAFLATMQMLKVAFEVAPGIETVRRAHEALGPGEQHDSMLLRTWLAASIFAAGTIAIVSPLIGAHRSDADRVLLGRSALQGVALALLWSPFFVAMAVCTRLSTRVTLGGAVGSGLIMAAIGLTVSHVAFGGALRRVWIAPLWKVFLATVAMAAALLAANKLWGLNNSEAIVAGVPWIAVVLARREIRNDAARVAGLWLRSLRAIAPEALLVSAALILGEAIKGLLAAGVIAPPAALADWPLPLLLVWPSIAMVALAALGLHPIVGASLLFPVQASVAALDPTVAAGTVMVGWMLSILLSTFAVPVMFTSALFGVSRSALVRGGALKFAALYAPLVWTYLWIFNLIAHSAG